MKQSRLAFLEKENKKLKSQLECVTFERDKYKMLFDASADALSIIDLKSGKFVECNQSAVQMHGVASKAQFLTLKPSDLSPECQPCGGSSEALAIAHIEKACNDGAELFQWFHTRLDGSAFPCLVSLTAIHLKAESFILAIGRDISQLVETQEKLSAALTDLKLYESAYQKEKKKFETFVDLAPIGIAINSFDTGAFVYVNREFGRFTGYNLDELNQMDYWALTPENYQIQEETQLASLAQTGRYGPYQKEYIHKKGHHYPVLLSGIKITDEQGESFIWSVVQDISEQKVIEKQLVNAKKQADATARTMQLANDSAGIGVWEWDLVSNDLIWDEWMYKLYGVSPEQFSGAFDAWVSSVHPDDIDDAKAELFSAIEGRGQYNPEFRVIHPNGDIRTIKASAEVLLDEHGQAVKVVGVNYDVTEKVSTMARLAKAKLAAENAARAKSEFLSNMSHEIRTPMNAILGGLQLLRSASLEEGLGTILDNATYSAKSLLTIINDILDYSKIESNKLELEQAPFSLIKVLDSIKYDLDSQVSNKGIKFLISIDQHFVDGWLGDFVRVKQIFLNLASNAVKFTNEGRIELKVAVTELNQHQALAITVIDTGIGMDEAAQKKIFERFSQADTSTTRQYGGTGLGMSITNSLVTLMQGTIELTSVINKGTSVHVVLPLKQVALVANNEHVATQFVPDMGGRKILIAEDNKINQIVIQTMLKATQADVTIVDNGLLAVEAFAAHHFDLVLMDIHMPEMDGIEAQKKIKQMNDQVPIIALTANVMANHVAAYLNQGFVAHIGKPIDMQNLFDVLQRYN
ncbi:hypothetical protein PULV_b0370 [Pseudoalteromonas ulvae UL12]|uniref:PAS domain-containing hybrid sensor histidine kinase/response regulator n=1 Tax=Pseudoalteromonas ulvae TaxID=107327 RepID=UPI00186B6982|nr:PAS domain S-box protein [Pseudoalteromonas ulvae]MBE0365728.1 hypothetical protein [Pseudoalteromonas ulvae UL12]